MPGVILFILIGSSRFFIDPGTPNNEPIIKATLNTRKIIRRNYLVGRWKGELRTDNGGLNTWTIQRNIDGTYKTTFKFYTDGKLYKQIEEEGLWGISGNIYFTMTKSVTEHQQTTMIDPSDPYYYDAYRIMELTEKTFRYKHVENHMEFTTKKISRP